MVDEAYIDFSQQESCINLLNEFQNLIVLQTFSKALGMAGARLGIAFTSTEILQYLNKVKMPYNINELTQQAGLEALRQQDTLELQIHLILQQKKWLEKELQNFNYIQKVFPSDANFLLVKTQNPNDLYQFLTGRKIIVRNRSAQVGCEGCLRFTVGLEQENKRLIEALKEYQITITQNEKSIISR